MTKFTQIGLAAVLLLGVASPALAVDATAAAGAATSAAAGAVVDPTATGSVGDVNALVTKLQASTTADFAAFTDASTIKFVTVSSLQGDPAALDAELGAKAEQMAALHTSIEGNAALKAKIEAGGYKLDDVLAVETDANGEFWIYIDDRA
jgi:hypothetical protein